MAYFRVGKYLPDDTYNFIINESFRNHISITDNVVVLVSKGYFTKNQAIDLLLRCISKSNKRLRTIPIGISVSDENPICE